MGPSFFPTNPITMAQSNPDMAQSNAVREDLLETLAILTSKSEKYLNGLSDLELRKLLDKVLDDA